MAPLLVASLSTKLARAHAQEIDRSASPFWAQGGLSSRQSVFGLASNSLDDVVHQKVLRRVETCDGCFRAGH